MDKIKHTQYVLHTPCSCSSCSCRCGETMSQNCRNNGRIFHLPGDVWVWRDLVELYWQKKTKELRWKPVPVSLYPPHIPYKQTRTRTRFSAVRGRRLTTWAIARLTPWLEWQARYEHYTITELYTSLSVIKFPKRCVFFRNRWSTKYKNMILPFACSSNIFILKQKSHDLNNFK
jgi:hypothetical protein